MFVVTGRGQFGQHHRRLQRAGVDVRDADPGGAWPTWRCRSATCRSCVLALAGIGALAGFFVLELPGGLVFLGDGGAYFVGFYVAEVAILLLHRNPQVSPMFPLLACIYPVFETLFSMYRRRVLRDRSPGVPDGIHLHSLIYRRADALGRRRAARRSRLTRPQLDDLALPVAALHVRGAAGDAVLGQHRRAGCVHRAVRPELHVAVLAHRALQGAALDAPAGQPAPSGASGAGSGIIPTQ